MRAVQSCITRGASCPGPAFAAVCGPPPRLAKGCPLAAAACAWAGAAGVAAGAAGAGAGGAPPVAGGWARKLTPGPALLNAETEDPPPYCWLT
jgi:hypothetical protein